MPEVCKTIQQADITPYLVGCCVLLTAAAIVAGTNPYLKYGFVPPHRISIYYRVVVAYATTNTFR
jgi:hypothetical protein